MYRTIRPIFPFQMHFLLTYNEVIRQQINN